MAEGVAARPTAAASSSTPSLLLPTLPFSLYEVNWLADWSRTAATTLSGYQLWAVEQRVTDRTAALPVIVVFTGDKNDTISAQRFSPSTSLSQAQQARVFEDTKTVLRSSGAKLSEARHERGSYIPITSLPSLDPNLSIVQLPGGDYESVMQLLFANINLRRLGLGGRSGLRLTPATPAQQLHFRQSFRLPIPSPSAASHPSAAAPSASTSNLTVPSSQNGNSNGNHSTPAPTPFAETILSLIRLVQHALALYGLGIVRIPLPFSGVEPAPPPFLTHADSEEWAEATAAHVPAGRHLTRGDGLLCDTTLSALSLFRRC
ncbi:hypothetical protein BCR35DRAFT_118028 [Leucosporidium creatinivorum]|uniref:STB6-like N-terminal domain-containing protein n=1 Tax=Leucosporidium creatinivorum TaxID=106004 RepID=A0A1Y2F055_9BASI|nr:hypothetical protein BCR35DRAFT_118028 [Leucosporidium creatinivorum]